jgi:hypothetical protein
LIAAAVVGGKEQEEAKPNGMISAIGASLGALALLGLLVLFFILMKRRKPEAIIEEELGDDETIFDSTDMGSDDVFISEYGFSDRLSQGDSGDEHGNGNGAQGRSGSDDTSGNELLVSEYGFSGEGQDANEFGGDGAAEIAEADADSGPPECDVSGEYGVSEGLE